MVIRYQSVNNKQSVGLYLCQMHKLLSHALIQIFLSNHQKISIFEPQIDDVSHQNYKRIMIFFNFYLFLILHTKINAECIQY